MWQKRVIGLKSANLAKSIGKFGGFDATNFN